MYATINNPIILFHNKTLFLFSVLQPLRLIKVIVVSDALEINTKDACPLQRNNTEKWRTSRLREIPNLPLQKQ